MPLQKVDLAGLLSHIIRRMEAMVRAGARSGAKYYRKELIRVTHPEYPHGPFFPPHSRPGEYPYRETGQAADNVEWDAFTRGFDIQGYYGVLGKAGVGPYPPHDIPGGAHVIELNLIGGRKGPADIIREYAAELQIAMATAVRSAP